MKPMPTTLGHLAAGILILLALLAYAIEALLLDDHVSAPTEAVGRPLTAAELAQLVLLNQQITRRFGLDNLNGPVKTVTEYPVCQGRCAEKPANALAIYRFDSQSRLTEKHMTSGKDSVSFHYEDADPHPVAQTKNTYGIVSKAPIAYTSPPELKADNLSYWRKVDDQYVFYRKTCPPKCGCTIEERHYRLDGRLGGKSQKSYAGGSRECSRSEVTKMVFSPEGHLSYASTTTRRDNELELLRESNYEYQLDAHGNWLSQVWCRTPMNGDEMICQTTFRDYEYH